MEYAIENSFRSWDCTTDQGNLVLVLNYQVDGTAKPTGLFAKSWIKVEIQELISTSEVSTKRKTLHESYFGGNKSLQWRFTLHGGGNCFILILYIVVNQHYHH